MKSIYDLSFNDLTDYLKENSLSPFVGTQIFDWIYKKKVFDIEHWTNVGKKTKELLLKDFTFTLPRVVWAGLSKDGTRKFLIRFDDAQVVETVLIPGERRLTICLSSQVGCAIGCTFCHTGTQGLTRNLKASEIVGQLLAIYNWMQKEKDVTPFHVSNIVFMGQGEPLHNFNHVKKSCEIFLESKGFYFGQRKVTLSTSGLVPQIKKLGDFPPVNLAISLHAAHNDVRSELMPINNVFDLQTLFSAIKEIPLKAHRYITFEYILIKEMNDGIEDIKALCELLPKGISKINLIPFNEYPDSKFKRPDSQQIKWFMNQLNARGYICTVRRTMGQDILAACGQLKGQQEKLNLWQDEKTKTA